MAMLIREEHQLPTLRLRLRARRDAAAESDAARQSTSEKDPVITRPLLSSQILSGEQAVSPWVDTELEALGFAAPAFPDASRSHSGSGLPTASLAGLFTQNPWSTPSLVGTPLAGQIAGLAEEARGGLLWLHIAQDSAPLALLPWEAMARAVTSHPFIRIPNFLNAPFAPSASPTIVVCASAPVGDGPYACPAFIDAVIAAIHAAADVADVTPTIHLFVDEEVAQVAYTTLASLGQNVRLHRFTTWDGPDVPRPGRELWMDWIVDALRGQPADIVHFIGPGYLGADYGAIVLAESPIRNERKGSFLGASDLSRFYDRIGCTAMAFSNPAMPEWVAGQRSLAFELSWLRAGPVVLTETDHQSLDVLDHLYTLLFGRGDVAREKLRMARGTVNLSCHPTLFAPQFIPRQRVTSDAFEAAAAYVRNQDALLAPTRTLSLTEQVERRGSEAAVDFLSSLVGQSRL